MLKYKLRDIYFRKKDQSSEKQAETEWKGSQVLCTAVNSLNSRLYAGGTKCFDIMVFDLNQKKIIGDLQN